VVAITLYRYNDPESKNKLSVNNTAFSQGGRYISPILSYLVRRYNN